MVTDATVTNITATCATVTCACGSALLRRAVEEWDARVALLCYACRRCGFRLGIEVEGREAAWVCEQPVWTDEARHRLDRLPPYVEPLVRRATRDYARAHDITVLSTGVMMEAENHGMVPWHPDAERRVSKIPVSVRAMARVELERMASNLGMSEVTVGLMEEMKARYFGMASPSTVSS